VELTVPGYEVDYRRTYFADNLDTAVAASEDAPTDAMTVTMGHGAPAAHELFFEAHLQTLGPPALATPQQKTVLEQNETTDAKGKHKATLLDRTPVMMQRYIITYGLLTRQLEMPTTPDGVHHANLEFAAVSYDNDGLKLNGIRSTVAGCHPSRPLRPLPERRISGSADRRSSGTGRIAAAGHPRCRHQPHGQH
jgi:hypothetical protein